MSDNHRSPYGLGNAARTLSRPDPGSPLAPSRVNFGSVDVHQPSMSPFAFDTFTDPPFNGFGQDQAATQALHGPITGSRSYPYDSQWRNFPAKLDEFCPAFTADSGFGETSTQMVMQNQRFGGCNSFSSQMPRSQEFVHPTSQIPAQHGILANKFVQQADEARSQIPHDVSASERGHSAPHTRGVQEATMQRQYTPAPGFPYSASSNQMPAGQLCYYDLSSMGTEYGQGEKSRGGPLGFHRAENGMDVAEMTFECDDTSGLFPSGTVSSPFTFPEGHDNVSNEYYAGQIKSEGKKSKNQQVVRFEAGPKGDDLLNMLGLNPLSNENYETPMGIVEIAEQYGFYSRDRERVEHSKLSHRKKACLEKKYGPGSRQQLENLEKRARRSNIDFRWPVLQLIHQSPVAKLTPELLKRKDYYETTAGSESTIIKLPKVRRVRKHGHLVGKRTVPGEFGPGVGSFRAPSAAVVNHGDVKGEVESHGQRTASPEEMHGVGYKPGNAMALAGIDPTLQNLHETPLPLEMPGGGSTLNWANDGGEHFYMSKGDSDDDDDDDDEDEEGEEQDAVPYTDGMEETYRQDLDESIFC